MNIYREKLNYLLAGKQDHQLGNKQELILRQSTHPRCTFGLSVKWCPYQCYLSARAPQHHAGTMSDGEAATGMAPTEQRNYLGFDFSTQQVSHCRH